jgi:hypothetical protein
MHARQMLYQQATSPTSGADDLWEGKVLLTRIMGDNSRHKLPTQ